jgi:hypothetical protein
MISCEVNQGHLNVHQAPFHLHFSMRQEFSFLSILFEGLCLAFETTQKWGLSCSPYLLTVLVEIMCSRFG